MGPECLWPCSQQSEMFAFPEPLECSSHTQFCFRENNSNIIFPFTSRSFLRVLLSKLYMKFLPLRCTRYAYFIFIDLITIIIFGEDYKLWNFWLFYPPERPATCCSLVPNTRWFKYDRDDLCVNKSQFVPVIFEPPCSCLNLFMSRVLLQMFVFVTLVTNNSGLFRCLCSIFK